LSDCSPALCGDGHLRDDLGEVDEGFEACDDGNESDEDACVGACALAVCGDGFARQEVGEGEAGYEACDDSNEIETDGCRNDCSAARCGDGLLRTDIAAGQVGFEQCDDGNANDDDDCQNNCFEPRGEFFLVGHGGWNFYKVPVLGRMSDVNVHAACQAAGLVTPCAGAAGCRYNNNNCTVTSEVGCGNPMMTTAGRLCNGARPNACVAIRDTFTYMGGNWSAGSSCGVVGNSWCAAGNSYTNKYAFCARRQ
jgi:hypothetical protein